MNDSTQPRRRFPMNEDPGVTFQKALKKPIPIECVQIDKAFEVESMEGLVQGKPGDWLMRGIEGELYVCDKTIFEKTYELLDNEQ